MTEISYRTAVRGDIELILKFIRDLAEYEHLAGEVVAEPGVLADWLFEKRVAKVVFVMCDGAEAGFALYFHNFSTFLGRGRHIPRGPLRPARAPRARLGSG